MECLLSSDAAGLKTIETMGYFCLRKENGLRLHDALLKTLTVIALKLGNVPLTPFLEKHAVTQMIN